MKTFAFCTVAEVKRSGFVTRWIDELRDEISAYWTGERVVVYSSICPHFAGDFAYDRKRGQLRCRWHGWKFDVNTGQSMTDFDDYKPGSFIRCLLEGSSPEPLGCFPFRGQLRKYDFEIHDDVVKVVVT